MTETSWPFPPSGERLAGKAAIVTGAGQQRGRNVGNGRAIALAFAGEGARVLCADVDLAGAQETADLITAAGGTAIASRADVTVEDDCQEIAARAVTELGAIDVLHHNVGVAAGDGWLDYLDLGRWQHIMTTNAGGAILMARAVLSRMVEAGGGGSVTMTSSIASLVAGSVASANPPLGYKMSKAALDTLTRTLAQTHAEHGIRVNAILPGLVDTPMGVDSVAEMFQVDRDEYSAGRDKVVPLRGGQGSAWDVAAAAVWLASAEARFVTGVLLPVDGGQAGRIG